MKIELTVCDGCGRLIDNNLGEKFLLCRRENSLNRPLEFCSESCRDSYDREIWPGTEKAFQRLRKDTTIEILFIAFGA